MTRDSPKKLALTPHELLIRCKGVNESTKDDPAKLGVRMRHRIVRPALMFAVMALSGCDGPTKSEPPAKEDVADWRKSANRLKWVGKLKAAREMCGSIGYRKIALIGDEALQNKIKAVLVLDDDPKGTLIEWSRLPDRVIYEVGEEADVQKSIDQAIEAAKLDPALADQARDKVMNLVSFILERRARECSLVGSNGFVAANFFSTNPDFDAVNDDHLRRTVSALYWKGRMASPK